MIHSVMFFVFLIFVQPRNAVLQKVPCVQACGRVGESLNLSETKFEFVVVSLRFFSLFLFSLPLRQKMGILHALTFSRSKKGRFRMAGLKALDGKWFVLNETRHFSLLACAEKFYRGCELDSPLFL